VLPKTAEYALRAAVCLAAEPGIAASADDMAAATKVPRRYLRKVLQDLVHAGLVRSQPGPGGGYTLAKSPEKVAILDVVDAVAPIQRIERCPLGLRSHTSLCPLHQELDQVYAATQKAFSRVTLAQLLRSKNPIKPLCEVC
jgi:Rrf2 family transcriptional regulator, nitric oxide-sensitive transcriptional repressor